MRCLLTGGLGFIGSTTVDLLIEHGHEVSIIDNLSTGYIENKNINAKLYKADIRDKGFIHDIIQQEQPDVLIHFAAQSSVPVSIKDPLNDCEININGTINLLDEFSKLKDPNRKFIFISSAAVYGQYAYFSRENDELKPKSYYAISKLSGEHYTRSFSEAYNFKHVIFRPSCVYGPRQRPNGESAVIAIFKNKLTKNEDCTLFKGGEQKRDFVYVKDVAAACLAAIENSEMDNDTFNVSSQLFITIDELFDLMKTIYQSKGNKLIDNSPRPWDANIVILVNHKLRAMGWKPSLDFIKKLRELNE